MRVAAFAVLAVVSVAAADERTTVPILDAPTLTAACKQTIADSRELTKELASIPIDNVTAGFLARWDDHSILIENVRGPVGLLTNVHPDKRVRDAGDDCELKMSARLNEINVTIESIASVTVRFLNWNSMRQRMIRSRRLRRSP